MDADAVDLARWARSGAMALTGTADGAPVAAPAAVASAMVAAAADLAVDTARWGRPVEVDGPALLGERAALAGLGRRGSTSVGGAARFVRVLDGWTVLNLPRAEDVAALPALVGASVAPDDWPAIADRLALMPGEDVVATATALGMAAALPGSAERTAAPGGEIHRGGTRTAVAHPLVVDLTSLWAGPLLTSLLAVGGARVIKVEGRSRPDGARRGPAAFFDLLNGGKECVTVDFEDRADVAFLRTLVAAADLVVEGSRPRVMDRLGIDPFRLAVDGVSWLSLTGHGRTGPAADRIGFGDDAAVAGGLFVAGDPPMFVADAVADPIAGLSGATLAADMLAMERASVVDLPLARAAAWARSRPVDAPARAADGGWVVDTPDGEIAVAAPRARPVVSAAAALGAHDRAVRVELAGAEHDRGRG